MENEMVWVVISVVLITLTQGLLKIKDLLYRKI